MAAVFSLDGRIVKKLRDAFWSFVVSFEVVGGRIARGQLSSPRGANR